MLNYSLGASTTNGLKIGGMCGELNRWLKHERPQLGEETGGGGRKLGGGFSPDSSHLPWRWWTGWGGIVVTLPWFMYQYQGDLRVLEENFEMIKRMAAFLDTHVENNLLKRYGGQWDFWATAY